MRLPSGKANTFEAAGKQGFVWGWEAGNKGLVSSADRAYMKAPVLRPTPYFGTICPELVATLSQNRDRREAILRLFRLDYPSVKPSGAVNGGAKSAVHLDH